jgi:hypothetical protein
MNVNIESIRQKINEITEKINNATSQDERDELFRKRKF